MTLEDLKELIRQYSSLVEDFAKEMRETKKEVQAMSKKVDYLADHAVTTRDDDELFRRNR